MKKKPIIGLTSDLADDQKYSHMPYFALRKNYSTSLLAANSTPILIPPIYQSAKEYIDLIDALVLTGGHFDIPPTLYGESIIHNSVSTNDTRTNFEIEITKLAIKKKMPILGICGGMQLLNVIYGGTLFQHIPDSIENSLNHERKPYSNEAHQVSINNNSLLYKLSSKTEIGVNSSHHQAINKVGTGLTPVAFANDGVVEALENNSYPFMVGVQWHPEYQVSNFDQRIFNELVRQAKHFSAKRHNLLSRIINLDNK